MWHNICMKIGIIGNGNHSKRIQKILKKKKIDFFIYKPKKPDYFEIHKFNQLKKCNVIFIVSPNMTHFFYIKRLYKKRYIFCEKPPVNTKKELSEYKVLLAELKDMTLQEKLKGFPSPWRSYESEFSYCASSMKTDEVTFKAKWK